MHRQKVIYEKWQVSDEYRQRIKQAMPKTASNVRFIESPERMRRVMAEFMQHRTVAGVAKKAQVDTSVVQQLIDTGIAPYIPTRQVMKTLGIDATALPAECVAA